MSRYKYRAKKDPTNVVEGRIEARSEEEAVDKISELGYIPIQVEEEKFTGAKAQPRPLARMYSRIGSREITVFTRELASLLKSGVPILDALNIISEQSENLSLRNILKSVHDAVKEGSTLSSALLVYPRVFPALYIAMVRTGENSGMLPGVLMRIAEYRTQQEEMLARFRMAMAYPVLMGMVGLATVIFMLTFVMPRLMKIFLTIEQDLPLPTKILISISSGLRQWWPWILFGVVFLIVIVRRQIKTRAGMMLLSQFYLHLPVFGRFITKAELARFSRTLELLVKNGIPILKSLEVATPVLGNEVIKEHLQKSYKELEQGGSLGKSLKGCVFIPLFMSNLISVGEESGRLAEALGEVAAIYERDTDEAIKVLSSLLEPMMILAMGLIVGFIVVAMLLPLFEINIMMK